MNTALQKCSEPEVMKNSTYLSPAGFGAVEKPHAVDSQGKISDKL